MPIAASRSDSGTSPAVGAASAVPSSSPPSPRHSIGTRYCRRPTNGCVPPASTTPSPRSLAHESWSPSPTPSSPGTRRGSQNHPPTAPTLNRRNRNEKHGCFFRALDALAVDDRGRWAGLTIGLLAAQHVERVVDAIER